MLSDHPSVVLSAPLREGERWDTRCLVGEVFSSAWAQARGARSDLQLMTLSGPAAGADVRGGNAGTAPELVVMTVLYRPQGRGRLQLRCAAGQRPRLHYGYLDEAADRERLREGVRRAAAVLADPAVRERTDPGAGVPSRLTLDDDATLDRWMRAALRSTHHTCGTCPMGGDADPAAVVDARGLVRGIDGLRIADLSIAPVAPSAPTHATALMIGERIAGWMRAVA